MSSHRLSENEVTDIYLSRSLKKWIDSSLPPIGSRTRLITAAVNQISLKAVRRKSRHSGMGVEIRNYSEYFNDLFAQSMAHSLQSPTAAWNHI
jgi:hypothetical protein